ncbi:MAG: SAM-dependent methyltransferase [Cyclobacteriaceae bacterium]
MLQPSDVYGQALNDFFYGRPTEELWVHTSYGTREEMPVDWFFREPEDFPTLEQYALSLCRGTVLDIGAGVGSHVLALQENGLQALAVEQSLFACEIMEARGVKQYLAAPYEEYEGPPVDTMLLLMNGIGLVGSLSKLSRFLEWAKKFIQPEGQLLFDSSDISYLFDGKPQPKDYYYGEVQFQYEYREQYGEWFSWLYIDFDTLWQASRQSGWEVQRIYEDETQQYLARLTRVS